MKDNYTYLSKFILLFFINTLFFCILVYLLPLSFEENDDAVMCMIASGAYSGTPDAHLVFINYLYGLVLVFLYKTFHNIEWYTVSFCGIHILSLSIIFYKFVKLNKPLLLKILFILLLYAVEVGIILAFQFTTTAAIGAFAGALLLLEKKRQYQIFGIFLFLIAALVRFDAAMLVLLLMLPLFIYEILLNKSIALKISIPVVICICTSALLQLTDNQIYKSDAEWGYYKKYNSIRGKINDNPNAKSITNDLPEGVTQNDYLLLLKFFPDGQTINLQKIEQLGKLIQRTPFVKKITNISLSRYKTELVIISLLFILCFLGEKQKKKKYFLLIYFVFIIGVLSFISLDGEVKNRVLVTTLFPVFFFLYYYSPPFRNKILAYSFVGILLFFSLFFINETNNNRKRLIGKVKYVADNQLPLMNEAKNLNVKVVPFAGDFSIEVYCSPFKVKETFSKYPIYFAGWLTNIPLNKGHFDSYMSFVDSDVSIFTKIESEPLYSSIIQKALIEHYDCNAAFVELCRNDYYLLFQFKRN